jgi:glycosyltransferase involved in cell wall biosynthesis
MRICFVADARSPIARNWIEHFIQRGDEVHVISSYPCPPDILPGAQVYPVPMYFSGLSRVGHDGTIAGARQSRTASLVRPLLAQLRTGLLAGATHFVLIRVLAPFEILRHVGPVRARIAQIAPDLVHAMRIPFEGIVAAKATPPAYPLITSVWGNDFTLFAMRHLVIRRQTQQVLDRTDALHCDCARDLRIADEWGFDAARPRIVLPGAGGLQRDRFYPGPASSALAGRFAIPPGAPLIVNPRGFRGYVRNDVFFKAIPRVLEAQPAAIFACSGTQGNPTAEKWIKELGIGASVRLLPTISRDEMADLFRLAQITVSPSTHDGTPNTLLEAMACGCFPIAGDIESLREWITDGENGLLCDPADPKALAEVIIRALQDASLRERARAHNQRLIDERAEYGAVMARAAAFYADVVAPRRATAGGEKAAWPAGQQSGAS